MSYTKNLDLLENFDAEPVDHTLIKNVPAHIRSTKAKYTEACSILLANTDALKKWLEVAHDNAEEAYVHKIGTARIYSGAAAPTVYFSKEGGGAEITPLTGSIYVDTSDSNMLYVLIGTNWVGVKAADLKFIENEAHSERWIKHNTNNVIGIDNSNKPILAAGAWCKSTVAQITSDTDIITKAYFDSIIKNITMSSSTTAVDFPNGLQIRFAKKTDILGNIPDAAMRSKEVFFEPAFSTACLCVLHSFITQNTSNGIRVSSMVTAVSKDKFTIVYKESYPEEQALDGYYYFAIGY